MSEEVKDTKKKSATRKSTAKKKVEPKVEEKAREYGMIYRDEVKVIFDKDVKK